MHSRKWMIVLMAGLAWLGGELTCQAGQNIVRNGSFELDLRWNGTFMRQKSEYYLSFAKRGDTRYCKETGAEAWWSIGPEAEGIDVTDREAHSGKRSICVRGEKGKQRVLFSAFDRVLDKGPYTYRANCYIVTHPDGPALSEEEVNQTSEKILTYECFADTWIPVASIWFGGWGRFSEYGVGSIGRYDEYLNTHGNVSNFLMVDLHVETTPLINMINNQRQWYPAP